MTASFKDLKRSSNSDFDKLNKELSKMDTKGAGNSDDRFWQVQTDKAGNGFATIRFLPAPEGEDLPFVKVFSHAFKGPTGRWYIENCLSTIGEYDSDPVNQWCTELWASGDAGKKVVSGSGKNNPGAKRKANFYANIYVIKDPANPENEGKVFLFRFGAKLFKKITDAMNPVEDPLEQVEPINPVDLWNGANFRLKVRRVDGYPNYDTSSFDSPGPLLDSDEDMERVWKSEHSLAAFIAPDQFKSYDELKRKLDSVRAIGARQMQDEGSAPEPTFQEKQYTPVDSKGSEEDDDEFGFFKQLAED